MSNESTTKSASEDRSPRCAVATCSAFRWVIVGVHGLYIGQELTRQAAIRKHCRDLYIIPSPNFPTVLSAWKKCRAKGDRAQWRQDIEYHKRPIFNGDQAAALSVATCEARASIYDVCLQDLRAEWARVNQRQPEENSKDEPR